MSHEVSFELGCINVIVCAVPQSEGGPSLTVFQDINADEYRIQLLSVSSGFGVVWLNKGHTFPWSAAGRMQFGALAGTLAYAVNASSEETERFRIALGGLLSRLEFGVFPGESNGTH